MPERQVDHEAHEPRAGQGDLHHQPPGADQEVVFEPEVRFMFSRAEVAWYDSIWTHGRDIHGTTKLLEEFPFALCAQLGSGQKVPIEVPLLALSMYRSAALAPATSR